MGKQTYKYKACKRQFILNPYPNKISDEIKQLIEELLLKKISLVSIANVTKFSKKWAGTTQRFVRKKKLKQWG